MEPKVAAPPELVFLGPVLAALIVGAWMTSGCGQILRTAGTSYIYIYIESSSSQQ